MKVTVTQAEKVTPDLVAACDRLLPQLSPGAPQLSASDLKAIIEAPGTTLFVGSYAGEVSIVGTATLVAFRIPSGLRARLESLVVDSAVRQAGIGAALCRAALDRARQLGANAVDLTSAPSRQAANRLYLKLGFEARETNVYRCWLGTESSGPTS